MACKIKVNLGMTFQQICVVVHIGEVYKTKTSTRDMVFSIYMRPVERFGTIYTI